MKHIKNKKSLLSFLFIMVSICFYKSQSASDFYISDTRGNQNVTVNCNYPFTGDNCIGLTANYPNYNKTSQYSVASTDFRLNTSSSKTVIKQNLDDSFTNVIALPFTFCFYGEAFKSLVIGSNGMVSFDLEQANKPNAPNFTNTLPSANLPKRSIFGVLHDMYFSTMDDSEISYWVSGSAPFRKFVINFYKGRVYGCDSQTSSSQIVLYEGSNKIEVLVDKQDIPCSLAKYRNALIGINDETGTLGIAPPNRNTGQWGASQEAWLFTPIGSQVIPEFIWYDEANTVIGRAKDQLVCPKKEANYKLEMVYTLCNGETNLITRDINIKFSEEFPSLQKVTKSICKSSDPIKLSDFIGQLCLNTNLRDFDFQFKDNSTGQLVDPNTSFTINSNKTYSVTVSNIANPTCKATTTLDLQLVLGSYNVSSVALCDLLNDEVENNYELTKFNTQIVGTLFKGNIEYFLSKEDAENNVNAVRNANLTKSSQLFVRLSLNGCFSILGPIDIVFNKTPAVNSPVDVELEMCDINGDDYEGFDWKWIKSQLTSDPSVTLIRLFSSYNEAFNALPNQGGISGFRGGIYKLYARVEYAGGCFSIAELNLRIKYKSIFVKNKNVYYCFDGKEDISIDLNSLATGTLVGPLDGTVSTPVFYSTAMGAINKDPSKKISPNQIISDNGDLIIKTYFVRYETSDNCFSIANIGVYLVHLFQKNDSFNICDFGNNASETITLAPYTGQIVNHSGAKVSFFVTNQAAQDNIPANAMTSLTINGTATIYARAEFNTCVKIFPVTFKLVKSPDIKTDLNITIKSICDNNADNKENIDVTLYEPQINFNNEAVSFEYYQNYNSTNNTFSGFYSNPKKIELTSGRVVYVKVNNASGCFSVAKLTFTLDFYPSIYLNSNAVLKLCDKEMNFGETFDLSQATSQFFDPSKNTVPLSDTKITYYEKEDEANDGLNTNQIPTLFKATEASITVFVRVESKITGCFSVAPINLLSYFPAKAKNSIIKICDNNLDGFYDVNLMDYKDQMVQIPSSENSFTFYLNEEDIGIAGKEVKNPTNFILNPLVSNIWVKVENLKDCGSYAQVQFVTELPLLQSNSSYNIVLCDDKNDGKEIVDLSIFEVKNSGFIYEYFASKEDMIAGVNKILSNKSYGMDKSKTTTFYVKVRPPSACPNFFTIDVTLNTTPITTINDYYYCINNKEGLEIKPNFSGLDAVYYKWEYPDGKIVEGATKNFLTGVKTVGAYKLTLTNSLNCKATIPFKVINIDTPEIISLRGENDFYIVETKGLPGRKILYSMDLVKWQESNYFGNLTEGDYAFYARYADVDCYSGPRRGKIFTVPNGITPNDDGVNDVWKLTGLDVFSENSTLQIFDRFGAMVYQETSNTSFTWNGKLNGRVLGTNSYWYVITAADGRTYKGWILLKNRN